MWYRELKFPVWCSFARCSCQSIRECLHLKIRLFRFSSKRRLTMRNRLPMPSRLPMLNCQTWLYLHPRHGNKPWQWRYERRRLVVLWFCLKHCSGTKFCVISWPSRHLGLRFVFTDLNHYRSIEYLCATCKCDLSFSDNSGNDTKEHLARVQNAVCSKKLWFAFDNSGS